MSKYDVQIRVKIDGNEHTAQLQLAEDQMERLVGQAGVMEAAFKRAYDDITKEIQKYTIANDSNILSLSEWLSKQNLSQDAIQNTISELERQNKTINHNSIEWKKNNGSIETLQGAYNHLINKNKGLTNAQKPVTKGSQQMNMAISQMGYMMNDASMVAVNWRAAIAGVGNNLPFMVQGLAEATQQAKIMGVTVKSMLISTLMGPGGLILAINAITFLMQFLPSLFSKTTKEIKAQSKATKELRGEKQKLAEFEKKAQAFKFIDIETAEEELDKEISKLKTKITEAKEELAIETKSLKIDLLKASPTISDEKLDELVGGDEGLKKLNSGLGELKSKLGELSEIKETQEQLKTFAELMVDFDMSAKGVKLVINGFTNNELAALQNSLNEKNKTLKIGNKQYEIGTEKVKFLKQAIEELNKTEEEKINKIFSKKTEELELEQSHSIRMLELTGATEVKIYEQKLAHLNAKKALYLSYGKDVKEILFEATQTEQQLQNALRKSYLGYTKDNIAELKKKDKENNKLEEIEIDNSLFKMANDEQIAKMRVDLIENQFAKELALLEIWKEKELEKYKDHEEAITLTKEIYDKRRAEIIQDSVQNEMQKYEELAGVVVSLLTEQFTKQQRYSGAEIELQEMKHDEELQNLKKKLREGELTEREYELQRQVAIEQQSKFRQEVEEQDQGFIQRAARKTKEYLIQVSQDIVADFIKKQLIKLTAHATTEAGMTASTEAGVATRIGLLITEIGKTLLSSAAKILNAVASVFEWQASLGPWALLTIPSTVAGMVGLYQGIKKTLGFNKGGKLLKGEPGYFEGNHNEIVAPEEDFNTIAFNEIIPRVIEITKLKLDDISMKNILPNPAVAGIGYQNDSQTSTEFIELMRDVKYLLENPVPGKVFYGDRDARDIERRGRELNSRGRLNG